ncbi:MAG: response regulator [Candidatus Omnitrophica bacterium]|nr:response regulator [Candidatus Omnitrophota bacterium]
MSEASARKILICDADESIRESLKLVLSDHYDLILTDNGEQCLDCLEHDKTIGLVLLDMQTARINGLEGSKAIKEKHPALNIIAVTNNKSSDPIPGISSQDICGYIRKPFKGDEILDMVRRNIG